MPAEGSVVGPQKPIPEGEVAVAVSFESDAAELLIPQPLPFPAQVALGS